MANGARGPGQQLDPTTATDFWLMMRLYGPDKALFDKTWVVPDVEKVT